MCKSIYIYVYIYVYTFVLYIYVYTYIMGYVYVAGYVYDTCLTSSFMKTLAGIGPVGQPCPGNFTTRQLS